jgi:hypothetical protein
MRPLFSTGFKVRGVDFAWDFAECESKRYAGYIRVTMYRNGNVFQVDHFGGIEHFAEGYGVKAATFQEEAVSTAVRMTGVRMQAIFEANFNGA